MKSIEDEESKKIAVDINILERRVALEHCAALGFTLANTNGVDEVQPRALGMKGIEVDFDAIEVGESRSDVKSKKANGRANLGSVPDHANTEYISAGQQTDDREPEDFIKLDVGEGQDFETLNYNHKLRRKLRRAIDNAEIRKEMLVRQRALDFYADNNVEIPPELRTPSKPINVKGHRILENGTLETAKQERVRARMELAEFNTQMRILRRQAKDAAIYAGLRKHAELMGKIPFTDSTIERKGTINAREENGFARTESALKRPSTITVPVAAMARTKLSLADSEDSTSRDNGKQSQQILRPPSTSKDRSKSESPTSAYDIQASKRKKEYKPQDDGLEMADMRTTSTNSDRQAMIDAELALNSYDKHRDMQSSNNYGL